MPWTVGDCRAWAELASAPCHGHHHLWSSYSALHEKFISGLHDISTLSRILITQIFLYIWSWVFPTIVSIIVCMNYIDFKLRSNGRVRTDSWADQTMNCRIRMNTIGGANDASNSSFNRSCVAIQFERWLCVTSDTVISDTRYQNSRSTLPPRKLDAKSLHRTVCYSIMMVPVTVACSNTEWIILHGCQSMII